MKYMIMGLFSLLAVTTYAQVRGAVKDNTGEPIPGANVFWMNTGQGVTTKEDGSFSISKPSKSHMLVVSFIGFQNDTIHVSKKNQELDIILRDGVELNEVNVVSRRMGTMKLRSSVMNEEMISSAELSRAACCNLGESFVTNPSVDVSYSDAATGAKQIKLLGLSGTYVQMLTENIPNYRGAASPYGLGYVPGTWMQSIQVSKGAASVKNGYESVTGQIDVEYKKPKVADPLLVNLFANSTGRYEGNAVGAVELNDRLSTALFLNYYNEERTHDKNKDTFLDMPEMQSFSVMNRWHYQTPRFVSQSGIKVLADRRTSGQTSHTLHDDENFIPYTINNDANRVELFSKNGFILNQDRNESVAVIVSGSYHDQQSNYADKIYNVYESNIYASLLYESEFGDRHKLVAGLNYNWDNYSQRGNVIERYRPQERNVSESVAGAYAEYTWTPVENFTWMLGLRTDYSILHHWFVTPRMHLKYAPVHWLDLRASAGKGYRTTFIFPENSYLLASNRTWHIADDLKQEEAWNYGISASFHIPIKSEELTVNAEWFYTDFQNQVVIDMDKDTHGIYFYNLNGKSTSSVFQIDVTYPLFRGFTLLGAYRWMDVKCTYGDRTLRKPLTSRYKALVTASYETSLKKWQFDVTVQFNGGGRMPTPDAEHPLWNYTFPSYTLLSAQVTRRFRRWNIYVGGENLTNYKQKNPIVSAGDPYSPDFDATMVWGPTMGYKLYAGIRYNIPKM